MCVLKELNPEQRKAAMQVQGPLLILAGAGSGKTKTITHRIAYMVTEEKIDPTSILAVTFTNKAAYEMKKRIYDLVGNDARYMTISTFHSFGVRLLKQYGEIVGYDKNFNIYDAGDQQRILKSIMKNYNIDSDNYKPSRVASKISHLKEQGISITEYEEMASNYYENTIAKVYREYQKELRQNNSMDFADILVNTKAVLENKEVLRKVQNRYHYVMIDEYQDTNKMQYDIVNMIAEKHKNLCVVGDEDQSIYGFRGADIRNILNFESDYKDTMVIKLEQNYRSTSNILEAANSVISNNTTTKGKKLWTDQDKGNLIRVYEGEDAKDEAGYVLKEIMALVKDEKCEYKDICILYRTNAQSRAFEDEMRILNIPYKIFGGLQFYQRKEIKDIIAFLNVINNPADDVSIMRIIDFYCQGVGSKTLEKISEFGRSYSRGLYFGIQELNNIKGLTGKAKLSLQSLYEILVEAKEMSKNAGVGEILEYVIKQTKYVEKLQLDSENDRVANLYELKNSVFDMEKQMGKIKLEDYLEKVSLTTSVDELEENQNYVKLMTIHNSKGLEFPVVFIVGMEEELFPGKNDSIDDDKVEEERRLCYVAITRAEKVLYMTHARSRVIYGSMSFMREPSRFLSEIPQNLLKNEKIYLEAKGYKNSSVKTFSELTKEIEDKRDTVADDYLYKIGQYITHKKFGEGKIKHVEPVKDKLKIFFPGYGEKEFKGSILQKFLV